MQAAALWWKGRLQPNSEVHAPHAPRCYSLQLLVERQATQGIRALAGAVTQRVVRGVLR